MTKTRTNPWLTVAGIGEDGWEGLGPAARQAVREADILIGGARHLAFIPDDVAARREMWPTPFRPYLADLVKRRENRICVLASGDPMFYGIGSHIARLMPAGELRVIPALSTFALVCARLLWPETDTVLISACGRPVEGLHPALFDGARIVLYASDHTTPAAAARLLVERGFGDSTMTVFGHVGGPREHRWDGTAAQIDAGKSPEFADLNTSAICCRAGDTAEEWATIPGLPDRAFRHDGQISRRDIRAAILSRLVPRPYRCLWDIGAGSGAIAIEWMRAAMEARAVAVEMKKDRAATIRHNATSLGAPRLEVIEGRAPDVLPDRPAPDAIFIGGGLATPGLLEACWQALKPGGRLAATAVTLESEALLAAASRQKGGELVRLATAEAAPLGRFTAWRPALPVVLWSVTKATKA